MKTQNAGGLAALLCVLGSTTGSSQSPALG
jgi:hypothetical protein